MDFHRNFLSWIFIVRVFFLISHDNEDGSFLKFLFCFWFWLLHAIMFVLLCVCYVAQYLMITTNQQKIKEGVLLNKPLTRKGLQNVICSIRRNRKWKNHIYKMNFMKYPTSSTYNWQYKKSKFYRPVWKISLEESKKKKKIKERETEKEGNKYFLFAPHSCRGQCITVQYIIICSYCWLFVFVFIIYYPVFCFVIVKTV